MERPRRSRRFFALMTLVVLLLALPPLLTYWYSDRGFDLRVGFARARGYDGCTCEDCADAFGFGPGIPQGICGTGWRARRAAFRGELFAASLPLGTVLASMGIAAFHRRTRDSTRCVCCGYDLAGLPSNRCPECGQSFATSDITPRA